MSSSYKTLYRYVSLLLSFCLIFNIIGVSAVEATAKSNNPQKAERLADIGEIPNKLVHYHELC